MTKQKHFVHLLLWLLGILPALGQTKIDLLTQTKGSLDVSAAPWTRPAKTGTSLPATCQIGEVFFKSNASAGLNLYGCTTLNVWTQQGGGTGSSNATQLQGRTVGTASPSAGQVLTWTGSAWDAQSVAAGSSNATQLQGYSITTTAPASGQVLTWTGSQWTPQNPASSGSANATQLQGRNVSTAAPGDAQVLSWSSASNSWVPATVSAGGGVSQPFQTSTSNSTTLSIGTSCTPQSPCLARFGNTSYQFTGSGTATISGGAGTAYIFISAAGALTVGHTMTVNCTGCSAQSGITAFPADSIPLYTWTATSGQWNSAGGYDWRAALSSKNVAAGIGVVTSEAAGSTVVSVDTAAISLRVAVPGSATSSCNAGSFALDASFYYSCVATNTWRRVALSSW